MNPLGTVWEECHDPTLVERDTLPELWNPGIEYCMNQQFTCPADPWLKGAILEKVLSVKVAGGGSDASPYHIRDLGTIFFVQAASQYLDRLPRNRPPSGAPAG